MHHSWLASMMTVFLTRASSYQAPYVDIQGLPKMSYYEPGDVNVAYMHRFSEIGGDGKLCRDSGLRDSSVRETEAAR